MLFRSPLLALFDLSSLTQRTFLPASGTTIHVTNPSALNSKQKRKRAKYVLLREDNRVLGSRGQLQLPFLLLELSRSHVC